MQDMKNPIFYIDKEITRQTKNTSSEPHHNTSHEIQSNHNTRKSMNNALIKLIYNLLYSKNLLREKDSKQIVCNAQKLYSIKIEGIDNVITTS